MYGQLAKHQRQRKNMFAPYDLKMCQHLLSNRDIRQQNHKRVKILHVNKHSKEKEKVFRYFVNMNSTFPRKSLIIGYLLASLMFKIISMNILPMNSSLFNEVSVMWNMTGIFVQVWVMDQI